MSEQHEANRAFWNASAEWWKEREDRRGLWRTCHENPSLVISPAEMPFLQGVRGQAVCVLGSGDNEVAFALAGLGGRVTSVDISEQRLEIARERARTLGLDVDFLQSDVTDLRDLHDGAFDLVYTGGHVSVWISDLRRFVAEAVRILKPEGVIVISEYHPIRRLWLEAEGPRLGRRYFERGPYRYTTEQGLPTFEFHWTVSDHIQAAVDAGCRIVKVDEYGEETEGEFWAESGLNKLPTYLLVVGKKDSGRT
jgi:ubiquinone/menaquinone biosynthesis C-methylase UbiE